MLQHKISLVSFGILAAWLALATHTQSPTRAHITNYSEHSFSTKLI